MAVGLHLLEQKVYKLQSFCFLIIRNTYIKFIFFEFVGSVIIWDIRTRKKVIEFQEHASPVTCITFHPFEFLLAAGRNDGTVDLYDLEAIKLISRTDGNSPFNGHTVKCITFR